MNELISPKYQMNLVKSVHDAIWKEYQTYREVNLYIDKWHEVSENWNDRWENFQIIKKESGDIDLLRTLHSMNGSDILKVA